MFFGSFLLSLLLAACFFLSSSSSSSSSCPPEPLHCGNTTLDIQFPFFTSSSEESCPGLHFVQCIDFVPAVHFFGDNYVYPVRNISYRSKTITIHDLRLSSYFRGSNCDFAYSFRRPIPAFNFTAVSVSLPSGESFFNCEGGYDFSRDIFRVGYNLTVCRHYSLYYFRDFGDRSSGSLPRSCSVSKDLWFHWELYFGGGNGSRISLLGVGFSPRWNGTDCFTCRISSPGDCSGADGSECDCRDSCYVKKRRKYDFVIGASITAAVVSVILISSFLGCIHLRRKKGKGRSTSISSLLSHQQSSIISPPPSSKDSELSGSHQQTHIFSYKELREATGSFDAAMQIGDGGFGTVYRGILRDGRSVAVKRLYESNFRRAEHFANEIAILSRLRHPNLVSLYGSTSPRGSELALVYEFVPNGTVADHLHGDRAWEGRLTWPLRLSVAVETAAALTYLHAVTPPIIHRDVKTGNILLDAEFRVKVADFGLSRLFPADMKATHISTAPQGTPGYLDPEYHQCYQLTDRSDVFSFGVVLAELVSSKPAVDLCRSRHEINLSTLVVSRVQGGRMEELMDPKLGFESDPTVRTMMRQVAELAFRCLQIDREMRPPVKEVLEVLRGIQSRGASQAHSIKHVADRICLHSPQSVTEKWVSSRSSTPNSSH